MTSACYRAASPDQTTWVELYAAIARRNSSDIVKFGNGLLGSHAPITEDDLAYLTTVMATTYVRMGQVASARSLLTEQMGRMHQLGQYEFPLANLVALTRLNSPASLTEARP